MIKDKLKSLLKKQAALTAWVRSSDLRFVDEFAIHEMIFPADHSSFHLQRAVKGLKSLQTSCGGFSNKFDFVSNRFGPMYPETTGYTLGTLINLKAYCVADDRLWIDDAIERSTRSLLGHQLQDGSFTGGRAGMSNFGKPSLFNSGQIALGLIDVVEYGSSVDLIAPIEKLSNFFKNALKNGEINPRYCFRQRDASYYTRALWGASRVFEFTEDDNGHDLVQQSAEKILSRQHDNGYIDKWGFHDGIDVLHTIIYALRGFWELGQTYNREDFLNASLNGMKWLETSGGKVAHKSTFVASSCPNTNELELCLTGLAQQGILAKKISKTDYKINEKFHINSPIEVLKSSQFLGCKNSALEGLLLGSRPYSGWYQPNGCPQWALKFFIDLLMLDLGLNSNSVKS